MRLVETEISRQDVGGHLRPEIGNQDNGPNDAQPLPPSAVFGILLQSQRGDRHRNIDCFLVIYYESTVGMSIYSRDGVGP